MCIAYIAKNPFENCELLIAMNRDEFYSRPFSMTSLHGDIYFPQDEKFGGTWFAFNKQGEFGLLTNIRKFNQESAKSTRGEIPINYLQNKILPTPKEYKFFNFIYGSTDSLNHVSSYSDASGIICTSDFTISNSKTFPSNWSKEETLREKFKQLFSKKIVPTPHDLFEVLSCNHENIRQQSDDTGYPDEIEKKLSSIFVEIPENSYGTVHQLLFMITQDKKIYYFERRIGANRKFGEFLEISFKL